MLEMSLEGCFVEISFQRFSGFVLERFFARDFPSQFFLLEISLGDFLLEFFSQTFFGIDFFARIQVQISLQILLRRDFS